LLTRIAAESVFAMQHFRREKLKRWKLIGLRARPRRDKNVEID
jgi:hypothetical protein